MSGSFRPVLLTNEQGNALVNQPDEPEGHGDLAALPAALEVNREDAPKAIDLGQIADENNASFHVLKHAAHSLCSNSEQSRVASWFTINFNGLNGIIDSLGTSLRRMEEPIFRSRSETKQPANDNEGPLEAEAA